MRCTEKFSFLPSFSLREGEPADFELTVTVGATKTGSVEEKPICAHPFHQVNPFAAEVAGITGVGGRKLWFWFSVTCAFGRFGL